MTALHDYSSITLEELREQVIERLKRAYAHDQMSDADFQQKLEEAMDADTKGKLIALVADLPEDPAGARRAPHQETPEAPRAAQQNFTAIMGGSSKRGSWRPPRSISCFALMGGIDLDFREADFASGVTQISCTCIMGGADIVVPPDVDVEVDGTGIMGGFDNKTNSSPSDGNSRPLLRITGITLMGGVDVKTKERGQK